MSEVNRATLITFGTQKVNIKEGKDNYKSIRLSLVLPESNEDTYPEYNYKELVAAAKKKHENGKNGNTTINGLDPFDDDSDVQRIAQEMEAKYGTNVSMKKKRKGRKDDYADIGMGYDESDSFIDNTDGYDEMIPQNVTTLHGGFYINCGALEFKTDDEVSSVVSSSSSDDENGSPHKASRKRALVTSDESEGEKETDKNKSLEHLDKKIKLQNGTNTPKVMKKKFLNHEKMKRIKKNQSLEATKKGITVKDLLREKRQDLDMSVPTDLLSPEKNDNENEKESIQKENKKPSSTTITDIIESVVKGNENNNESLIQKNDVEIGKKENNSSKAAILFSSEGESSRDVKYEEMEIVKLPENLPNDILDIINSIKEIASKSTEGKVKFFSGPVNNMLLSLEKKCKCLGKQSRLKVYEHLAPFVKCKKETLCKRAKNLVLEDEKDNIKHISSKLKAAIEEIMPAVLENYERESQRILQKNYQARELYKCAWFSKEGLENEEMKSLRMPKRRFPWSEETKKLVKELVQLRKKCFLMEGKPRDIIESLLEQFLKNEVQILWPEGWISKNALLKVCGIDTRKSINVPNNNKTVNNKPLNNPPPQNYSLSSASIEIQQNLNNPALSITPVTTVASKTNNNSIVNTVKNVKSDINISKISINDSGINKSIKTLPNVEITKNVHHSSSFVKHSQEKQEKDFSNCDILDKSIEISKQKVHSTPPETTIKAVRSYTDDLLHCLDESIKQSQNLKISKSLLTETQKDKTNVLNEQKHCQIIDLTDPLEKRKFNIKPKPKTNEETDKIFKPPRKDLLELKKTEMTGSSALTQIIADSLSSTSTTTNNNAKIRDLKHSSSFGGSSTSVTDYSKPRTSEGDDIQKVMEGLKVLHKMSSSPIKSNEHTSSSSPVSVIAYNKSYSPKTSFAQSSTSPVLHRNDYTKADFCTGFQDAFQKQLLGDFGLLKTSTGQTSSTSTKTSYNSIDKYPHITSSSGSSLFSNDKYLQNSNNNYTQPNTNKLKNNIATPQSGSYNMLDDMYANLLSEYGYSKSATHKPKSQQK